MATVIISAVIVIAMAAAIRYVVKSHKEGKCVGCSGGGCGGSCGCCQEEQKPKEH